jgi:hypothetical protein
VHQQWFSFPQVKLRVLKVNPHPIGSQPLKPREASLRPQLVFEVQADELSLFLEG